MTPLALTDDQVFTLAPFVMAFAAVALIVIVAVIAAVLIGMVKGDTI